MKHLLSIILIFTSALIHAQQKTDFNGTYSINKSKIDFGDAPDNILPVRYKILLNDDKLTIITTTIDDQDSESSFTETLIFGGAPVETSLPSGRKRKASVIWNSDKTAFTVISNSISVDGQQGSKITATWSFVDDGKTLFIDRSVEQANGLKYNIKGYYDRQ
jgi:hypothetical protein